MDKTTSLTQGNVFRTLIKFAVPVFAAMFLQSLYGGVDLLVVGQFAATADVSGVATGCLVVQILLCLAFYVYVEKQNIKHHRI